MQVLCSSLQISVFVEKGLTQGLNRVDLGKSFRFFQHVAICPSLARHGSQGDHLYHLVDAFRYQDIYLFLFYQGVFLVSKF